MKKLLLIAAVASMATPAMASKARVNALGNAEHLVDTQTVFENPSHLQLMGDFVTFEMGTNTPAGNVPPTRQALAEGGFVRSSGDAKYMVYLGRKSDFTHVFRSTAGFLTQENPIEIQYAMKGDINWGVGFNYSSSDKKTTSQKQQAMGIRLGASADVWEASAVIGLASTADGVVAPVADAGAKYKGTAGFDINGAYKMENLYIFGEYVQDGAKLETTAAPLAAFNGLERTYKEIEVGVIDHNKIEGGQWFYGVSYRIVTDESKATAGDTKDETTTLPFLVGLEYDAASWVTLRASAKQNVLIGSEKTTPPGDADTIPNDTTVAGGVGLRMGKFVLDASLEAATTGEISMGNGTTNKLMTNASLTYTF